MRCILGRHRATLLTSPHPSNPAPAPGPALAYPCCMRLRYRFLRPRRIALVGAPFYATYAAVKAGLARFGEALRRELKGEGIHVLTAYPGGTDTPMMKSNRAGPELGFSREPASAVADAIVAGIEANAFEVIRGGEARAQMIALNRNDPVAVDARFLTLKSALEEAVKDHSAL